MKQFLFICLLLAASLTTFAGGELDTTFSGDGISVNYVNQSMEAGRAVLVQPDGKTIIVGDITEDNTTGRVRDIEIRRVMTDGSRDTTFGNHGAVFLKIGTGDDWATGAALQLDGKIVIAGGYFNQNNDDIFVARLNADGTPDTLFGTNGIVKTAISTGDDRANAVVIQTDKRIVVAGVRGTGTAADSMILRFNPNGAFDPAFGASGRSFISLGSSTESFRGVALQSDGKIVAAGEVVSGTRSDFAVARFNTNGSPDSTFGVSGRVTTAVTSGTNIAKAVKIQTDGKIVVAGSVTGDFGVVRYSTTGLLDSSFSGDGKELVDFSGSTDSAETLQIMPDGKLFLGGSRTIGTMKTSCAARLNANGGLDPTFATGGKDEPSTTAFGNDEMTASTLRADGAVVGTRNDSYSGDGRIAYVEYDQTGSKISHYPGEAAVYFANSSVLLPDGKILVGGSFDYWRNRKYALVRLNADGSLDTTFGNFGRVVDCAGQTNCSIQEMKLQTDGRIIAVGGANGKNAAFRFNPDGTPDTTFGVGGFMQLNVESFARSVALDASGRALVLTSTTNNSTIAVYRLTTGGSVDGTFTTTELYGRLHFGTKLMAQPDGRIVVAGSQMNASLTSRLAAVRLLSTGAIDTGFGDSGQVVTEFAPGDYSNASAVLTQNDGAILLAGIAKSNVGDYSTFAIARYTAAGQADPTFGTDGKVKTDIPNSKILSVVQQTDGRLVVCGYSIDFVNVKRPFTVARYLPSGVLDQTWGTGGIVLTEPTKGPTTASSVFLDGAGKIVVAGSSGNYTGVVRYLP